MSYDDAFTLGSKVDGYIKCKYAMLYTPEHDKVFAIQKNYADRSNDVFYHQEQNAYGDIIEQNKINGIGTKQETVTLDYEIPVVQTDERVDASSKDALVPVKLTAHAAQIILPMIQHPDGVKWFVYRVTNKNVGDRSYANIAIDQQTEGEFWELVWEGYDKPSKADWVVEEKDKPYIRYEFVSKNITTPQYEMLLYAIKGGDITFYVKPKSIVWIPTNLNNFVVIDENGNPIRISDKLDEAKKKVNEAKAVLAAAGVATVIL